MIHISCKKISKIEKIPDIEQHNQSKPNGLWVAKNRDWIEFFSQHIGDIKYCKYMYKLKLRYTDFSDTNPEKVLRIGTEDTFDKFTFKYGFIEKYEATNIMFFMSIDWKRVAADYGGIEIIPLIKSRLSIENDQSVIKKYNKKFKFTDDVKNIYLYSWIDSWDIPSGCVWEPKAVKEFKRIYKI